MARSKTVAPALGAVAALAASVVVLAPRDAAAAPAQTLPFQFDMSLAANPSATQSAMTSAEAGLAPLPLASMTTLTDGLASTTLWFWPEIAETLTSAGTSGPGMMPWPTAPTMCPKHAAFAIPTLLVPSASASCQATDASVRKALSDLGACTDVEQPERYVIGLPPVDVNATTTSTIVGLVGIAGEAFSHTQIPVGVLPKDWVATLRTVLDKLRHDDLVAHLATAKAAYAQASSLVTGNAACFDAAASAAFVSALGDLGAEIDAASALLAKQDADGKAQSQEETVCLAARSHTRVALPFPSITEPERRWIAYWLGGVFWRMRGGGLMPLGQTQAARLDFLEQPFTRIGELTGGQDGSDAAFQIYLKIFDGWSEWMAMGRGGAGDAGDKYNDLVGMTNRGHDQVLLADAQLDPKTYDTTPLDTGGLQMGPCYFYAWDVLPDFRFAADLTTPYSAFIEGPTSIGEFCSGASIALGFADTLLAGLPTGKPPTVDLCADAECGDDGCGGSCGTCGGGATCTAGKCVVPQATDPGCGDACGAPGDGAGGAPGAGSNDGSGAPSTSSKGCACTTTRASDPAGALGASALAAVALGAFVARRRARARARRAGARHL